MIFMKRQFGLTALAVLSALTLAACSSTSLNRAPVEDRTTRPTAPLATGSTTDLAPVKLPQGYENAGKPGYYTVKPGDTLLRIALENVQSMHDVARWTHVENPNRIEVGQVLRVVPPAAGDVVIKPIAKPTVTASPAGRKEK